MSFSTKRLIRHSVNISRDIIEIYQKQKETLNIILNMHSQLNMSYRSDLEEHYNITLILVNLYKLKCTLDDLIRLKSKLVNHNNEN